MDRSDTLKLIAEVFTTNEIGVQVKTETEREVFCDVTSVTRTEWSDGGRIGLNPELRFTMFAYDYADEEIVEYNGKRYTVYRTYRAADDTVELYTERRKGDA